MSRIVGVTMVALAGTIGLIVLWLLPDLLRFLPLTMRVHWAFSLALAFAVAYQIARRLAATDREQRRGAALGQAGPGFGQSLGRWGCARRSEERPELTLPWPSARMDSPLPDLAMESRPRHVRGTRPIVGGRNPTVPRYPGLQLPRVDLLIHGTWQDLRMGIHGPATSRSTQGAWCCLA